VLGSGVLSAVGAGASEQPGSGLLGYTLSAQSSGLQVIEDRPDATTHPEGDGEVPQSVATLVSGPVGYALSSIAWPGALAGNAGSLLVLAGVPLPPDVAAALNDPVRAETRTGGQSDVRNDEVNGASMHASVVPGKVVADATVDGGEQGRTAGLGSTATKSVVTLATSDATTTADSTAKDLSLAAGVVTIGSVVSHATAKTDGRTATASGTTVVNDLRVAGIPVTVDEHGVTVGPQSSPVDAAAVEQAMQQLGMTLLLSKPSTTRSGGSVSYDAGSLIMVWTPPNAPTTITVLLGGSRVSASANPADPAVAPPGTTAPPVTSPGGTGQLPVVPGSPITPVDVPPATGGTPQSPVVPGAQPLAEAPLLVGHSAPASSYLLAGLAALLLLGALLRFPSMVLVPPAAATCTRRPT
jgi:hypothetical protein